mgnify:CR=1 FL=1
MAHNNCHGSAADTAAQLIAGSGTTAVSHPGPRGVSSSKAAPTRRRRPSWCCQFVAVVTSIFHVLVTAAARCQRRNPQQARLPVVVRRCCWQQQTQATRSQRSAVVVDPDTWSPSLLCLSGSPRTEFPRTDTAAKLCPPPRALPPNELSPATTPTGSGARVVHHDTHSTTATEVGAPYPPLPAVYSAFSTHQWYCDGTEP